MIRIYVLIRRNECTLIVPVRSTRIISCIFDAFRSCSSHSLCRANYKPLRFRVFLLLPPLLFFPFIPYDTAAYRRHVCNRRWIFFISRDPPFQPALRRAGRFKKYYLSWILSARPIPGQINHLFVIDRVTL